MRTMIPKDPKKSGVLVNPWQSPDVHAEDAGDERNRQENGREKRNNVEVSVGGLCSPTGNFLVKQSGPLLNGLQIESDAVETFNGAMEVVGVGLSSTKQVDGGRFASRRFAGH